MNKSRADIVLLVDDAYDQPVARGLESSVPLPRTDAFFRTQVAFGILRRPGTYAVSIRQIENILEFHEFAAR